jgi:hypothetical protein
MCRPKIARSAQERFSDRRRKNDADRPLAAPDNGAVNRMTVAESQGEGFGHPEAAFDLETGPVL